MDYLACMENIWYYLPYALYAYVFLTLLPKSLGRINKFASADYEANRNKFHKCYGPEICCHNLELERKPKQRKVVTRVYPKRKVSTDSPTNQEHVIHRQVVASSIQTQTNVNQIARMFESGGRAKKVNRVIPTILPEIKAQVATPNAEEDSCFKYNDYRRQMSDLENNENSQNLLNIVNIENTSQRRTRPVPSSLNFETFSGMDSLSPTESSPPASMGSAQSTESAVQSPVLRSAPFRLKSSLEDIYAAIASNAEKQEQFIYSGCNALSPVTSIEDILSQRRLSRPLSAYSISDLLNEEQPAGLEEAYVTNYLRSVNTS